MKVVDVTGKDVPGRVISAGRQGRRQPEIASGGPPDSIRVQLLVSKARHVPGCADGGREGILAGDYRRERPRTRRRTR